ncbi:serine threonine protein kinase [Ophiostoma piceae UAMH 11346]|uniref:Serine threonine protein kinase n=1 Tax=Ophiostoma piceae (strain UAMH 11346) TaxID=1262450 RepID=S3D0R2_OPHP1|nr:serine threonine protein kinase [Ophiostoma piceae UAMH 11346]
MATIARTITRGLRQPAGCELLEFGSTGAVFAFLNDPKTVAKLPFEADEYIARLNQEKCILTRLRADEDDGHPHVVRCVRMEEDDRGGRIILERATHGALRVYFHKEEGRQATMAERVRWCHQVASAVVYMHSKGVVQGDLGGRNILLREDRTVCLCDFAGSGIDGIRPEVWAQSGFRHPMEELQGTVQGELHALGSTIYEIVTSTCPHWEEEKAEVDKGWGEGKADELMRSGKYPYITGILLGDVIAKCWAGEFTTSQSVLEAIDQEVF